MYVTFVKAVVLTLLVVFQVQLADAALSYMRSVNLPLELALLVVVSVFVLGILAYHILTKRFFEKNKLSRTRKAYRIIRLHK